MHMYFINLALKKSANRESLLIQFLKRADFFFTVISILTNNNYLQHQQLLLYYLRTVLTLLTSLQYYLIVSLGGYSCGTFGLKWEIWRRAEMYFSPLK